MHICDILNDFTNFTALRESNGNGCVGWVKIKWRRLGGITMESWNDLPLQVTCEVKLFSINRRIQAHGHDP